MLRAAESGVECSPHGSLVHVHELLDALRMGADPDLDRVNDRVTRRRVPLDHLVVGEAPSVPDDADEAYDAGHAVKAGVPTAADVIAAAKAGAVLLPPLCLGTDGAVLVPCVDPSTGAVVFAPAELLASRRTSFSLG